MSRTIEISISPAIYPYRTTTGSHITVVIDVLRFTTSVISAFDNGVKAVIPVSSLAEAEDLKKHGYPVAAERDGLRLPFANYGNSATDFKTSEIIGKTLIYSTTNGTLAMESAAGDGPVVVAAFTNLPAVAGWLNKQMTDVVILCSGWKNLPCIEDTLCAGALVEMLFKKGNYNTDCDTVKVALEFWNASKINLQSLIENASHHQRLLRLGIDPMLSDTLMTGASNVLPVYENGLITDLNIQS
ncbi:MAG: 2-phosphosulfolactate phosphatase [Bacteroidota bacterium]